MADLRNWFIARDSNNAPSPDGAPEGMSRSGVNDSMREIMAAVKRWFQAPEFRDIFIGFNLLRTAGDTWTFQDDEETNCLQYLEDGQRIKMHSGTGLDAGGSWEGFIDASVTPLSYGSGLSTFGVTWLSAESTDTDGPQTTTVTVEVSFKELGQAAWYDTGAVAGKIPLFDDMDAHVTKAENTLDVGFLEGHDTDDLEIDSSRNRMNFNGGLPLWQRGTSFTAATALTNDADNVCADGIVMVQDGNNRAEYSRSTDIPDDLGVDYSMRIEVVASVTNKFGVLIPIEKADVFDHTNQTTTEKVTGSFYAKEDGAATGLDTLRAYLLNMKVEAPTVTPVQSWQNGSTGVNVAVDAAEWEIVASAGIALTTSWQRFTPLDLMDVDMGTVSAAGPMALLIVADMASFTAGEAFFLAGFQVNAGVDIMPFIAHPLAMEWQRAQRYCISTMENGKNGDANGTDEALAAYSNGSGDMVVNWPFPVEMFKAPTLVPWNPRTATANKWDDGASAFAVASSSISKKGAWIECDASTNNNALHHIAAYAHANIWGAN